MKEFQPGAKVKTYLITIVLISTAIRLVLAALLELGNDEVYYWTYAMYPALSHFDHPPLVGLVIDLFTLDGLLQDDFFMRLGPILLAASNTILLYWMVKKIGDEWGGLYAALFFNSSIYFSILSGFAILPDAPLILFWLLSLNVLIDVLPIYKIDNTARAKLMLFGVFAGLAVLSKYQGIFIWLGAILFILMYNRKWLTDYSFYFAGLISLLIALPIVWWNLENNFITLAFHRERVAPSYGLRFDYFIREVIGQMIYQNPLNYLLWIPAIIAIVKRKSFIDPQVERILILNGLPLWLVFTGFSLFRGTLPHWTGPAFLPVIILAALFLSGQRNTQRRRWPIKMFAPACLLIFSLGLAVYLINYSPYQLGKQHQVTNTGQNDFTQDMYGWSQIGEGFIEISKREEQRKNMPPQSDVISFRWFPGAHLDFYVAHPAGRKVFLIGGLNDIHKYAWINEERGGLIKGNDYYYIAPSNYYRDPSELFSEYFDRIEPIDTLQVRRGVEVVRYAFFYRMKRYKGNFKSVVKSGPAKE